jgi:hypothetical protein
MEMNTEGPGPRTPAELITELQYGTRFVVYQYCVSLLVITFKRSSDLYLVRPGESAVRKGMRYTLLSVLLGWWGIPWGLLYALESIVINLQGGKDVTQEAVAALLPAASPQERAELERLVPRAPDGKPSVSMDESGQVVWASEAVPDEPLEPGVRRRQVLVIAALVAVGLGVLALAIAGLGEWGQRTDSLKAGVWGLPAQATATWEARLARPAPTVAPGYVFYSNEDLCFSVHHPEGWLVEVGDLEELETGDLASGGVAFLTPTQTPEAMLVLWVQVFWATRGSPLATPTDQEYFYLLENFVGGQQLHPLEDPHLLDLDGFRAAQAAYTFTDSNDSPTLAHHSTMLYAEERTFFIVGTAVSENNEELSSVYDHFLASFRVLPAP